MLFLTCLYASNIFCRCTILPHSKFPLFLTHLIMQINSIFYLHRRSLKRITRKTTKKTSFYYQLPCLPPHRRRDGFSLLFFFTGNYGAFLISPVKKKTTIGYKLTDLTWILLLLYIHINFFLSFVSIDLLIFGSSHSLIAILFKLPCLLIMLPVCVTFVCVTTLNNVLT